VVAAAKSILSMQPIRSVQELAKLIIVYFTRFPSSTVSTQKNSNEEVDGVFFYAAKLLTLSLLWHGFHDAIHEGDGDRILRYWKFLFVIFKNTSHRNYAKEALNLLIQWYFVFFF